VSQEINLLNPALRPKQDWFSFRFVSAGALASLLLVLGFFALARFNLISEQKAQAETAARLANVQQELQGLQAALGARKSDPALEQEAVRLTAAVKQRGEVLQLASNLASEGGGVAEVMRGFSRQRVDGVWLTGFVVGPSGLDMRGRLVDPALLATYIRRLNAEPAFRGRHFAALDMHGVVPPPVVAGQAAAAAPAASVQGGPTRYTEFSLRATSAAAPNAISAGGKE
jgi:hypothetical protein